MAYFQRFTVKVSPENIGFMRPEMVQYIRKVKDTTGGRLALMIDQMQINKRLQVLKIGPAVDWGRLIYLSNLKELQIDKTLAEGILSIPSSFGNIRTLEKLIVRAAIGNFPDSVGNLTNLRIIEAESDQLVSLPESIGNLTKLETLLLSNNYMTSLPESIGNLEKLETLAIDRNRLISLPDAFSQLTRLEILNVSSNRFGSNIIDLLPMNLKEVHAHQANVVEIPDTIGNLSQLTHLDLANNPIRRISDRIGNLTNLIYLNLSSNNHTSLTLPYSIGMLTNLRKLFLQNSQMTSLPDSIGNLTKLEVLDLSDNRLTELPDSLFSVKSFVRVMLRNNPWSSMGERRILLSLWWVKYFEVV